VNVITETVLQKMEAFHPTLTLTGQKSFQGGSDGTTVYLYFLAFKTPGNKSEMKVTFPFSSSSVVYEDLYDSSTRAPPKVLLTIDDFDSFLTVITPISEACKEVLLNNSKALPLSWVLPVKQTSEGTVAVRAKVSNRTVRSFVDALSIESKIKGILRVTCVYSNNTQAGICLEVVECTTV